MYPHIRLRRNRKTNWIRDLIAESSLKAADLVLPLFVVEGYNQRQAIKTMPGIYRQSIDQVIATVNLAARAGIKAVALFPVIDFALKSFYAEEAYNPDNLVCRTIKAIKTANLDIGIVCDVALDPYTSHGHDGIILDNQNDVDNDLTVAILCRQALVLAQAGADIVAPSDMMDGRITSIRQALDKENFIDVNILSYAAKYNSSFYGPFRDALTNTNRGLNKATYQMDVRNIKEALREIKHDIEEGADLIMIKPGMPYLDVIHAASSSFNIQVFAYQVSGEYAMLKMAAANGALNWESIILESLIAFKRAGASGIFTYAALEVTELLNK
ncbi:MAG: porphobilinogen synthase [Rickettsiaceae bacterium]|nr:MAG: porphobilinogen synthase [Rickettsiaceae bacterium]